MSDYDLGRARGKVVIETDERGFSRAEGSMDDLGDSVAATSKKFDKATGSVTGYEKEVKKAAGTTDEMARKQNNLINVQRQATQSSNARRIAEKELRDVLKDSAATEDQVASAMQKRNSAVGQALKDAKALKSAQRDLNNEIKGIPDFDPGGKNSRQMQQMSHDAKNLERDIDKVGSAFGKLGKLTAKGGAGLLAGGAVGGAAGLLGAGGTGVLVNSIGSIVTAVSQMSGAVGVLPAVLSSAAFSMGSLEVATAGFGDAFGAIMDGDPEKFAEALGELSANAQQLFIQFNSLKPAIDAFKYAVQDVFSEGLDKLVAPMAQTYMPLIEDGMKGVAGAANSAIKDIAGWAQQSGVIADIKTFLDNNTAAMQTLASAAVPVAQAFLDIVTVGSDFLPQLAGLVQNVASEFSGWIGELRDNGTLRAWMQEGLDAVGQLWDILKQFGTAFSNVMTIWKSAGGQSFLDFLGKVADMFTEWTANEGAQSLMNFFSSINTAASALMPVLRIIGDTLVGTIFPMFANLGTATAPGLLSFFDSLRTAFQLLGPMLIQSAPAINQALTTFGTALVDIVKNVGPQLPSIMQAFADALSAIAPSIPAIAKSFAKLLETVGPLIPQLAAMITPALIDFFGDLFTWLEKDGPTMINFAGHVMEVVGVIEKLARAFEFIPRQMAEGLTAAWQLASEFLPKIGQFFTDLWNKVVDLAATIGAKALEIGRNLVQGMIDGIESLWGALLKKVGDLGNDVVNKAKDILGISSPSKVFHEIGVQVGQGFVGGITSTEGDARDATSGLADSAVGGMSTAFDDNDRKGIHGFVADMLQLTGFGSKLLDMFSTISQKIFEGIKLATTDPKTGKSTIAPVWSKTVSDETLRKANEDKAYQQSLQDAKKDATTGPTRSGPPGAELATYAPKLTKDSSKAEIQAALAAEAQRRGLSPDEVAGVLALAQTESNFDRVGFLGFSTKTADTGFTGGANYANDYDKAMKQFFDNYAKGGLAAQGGPDAKKKALDALASGDTGTYLDWLQNGVQGAVSGQGGMNQEFGPNIRNAFEKWQGNLPTKPPSPGGTLGGLPVSTSGFRPNDANGRHSQQAAVTVAGMINQLFGISDIGGARNDSMPYHKEGRALDVMIPGGSTMGGKNPEGKALGDQIQAWAASHAKELGLEDTIWQDFWSPQGNTGEGHSLNRASQGATAGHFDHVHLTFANGAKVDMPLPPEAAKALGNSLSDAAPWATPSTGDPRSQAIADNAAIVAAPDPTKLGTTLGVDLPQKTPDYVNGPGIPQDQMVVGSDGRLQVADDGKQDSTQDQILSQLRAGDPKIDALLTQGEDPNTPEGQIPQVLSGLDTSIQGLIAQDTPESRAQAKQLQSAQSDIAGNRGFTSQNPADKAAGMLSAGTGVAQDVIAAINAGLQSVDAAANIADTLVRGIENTEDIMNIIDNVQTFIDLASKVFAAAGSITSMAGSMTGGMDFGGTSAAGSMLSMISGIISAVNTGIDMAQEGYKIATKYIGKFLSFLVGAGQGDLMGDIKFLLDLNDNTLKRWSEDNPEDKRESSIPKWLRESDPNNLNQTRAVTPDVNLYIGPGTDPNDAMNAAMWELRTGGSGAFAYADY